ncbi:NAD(P)H-dependent oxidoreductase [Streptomyces sp. NPDC056626]|uniref:NAD(P)H-dependent oxidoreductase n=1 Tax=unclassified Streptomyces TaxID=2593676 RepID=UPI00369514D1
MSVSGSPSTTSRTACPPRHQDARLAAQGQDVPPRCPHPSGRSLLHAGIGHPDTVHAIQRFRSADGVVIVIPVYKAAYSGQLKALLDLLPRCAVRA